MSVQRRTLSSKSKRPTTMQVALYILKKEGILGLYAGSKAAMILVMNPIIQYAIFENIKTRLLQSKSVLSGLDYFMLGAFSKLCATIIMYPYM
jgi:adenine nucleotide transporter 17